MLPYNASDMLRAIRQTSGLELTDVAETAAAPRHADVTGRLRRWARAVAASLALL